ncbi:glutathione S-transferase family protein [Rhizorhabdus argentea]|uniref:glutathione S-transferase family protein n=1 Tax=Rhizorhabdus argentea TaxID=1387174 RepID=UPI0030EE1F3B
MIRVHHLSNSHSHVVLWLMEELALPYELVDHQRDPVTKLSPDSLRAIHPAAKAPAIEDHGLAMIESTGIILYILEAHGGGRLRPPADTPEAMMFFQWLTFIEGSAKGPLVHLFRASDDQARAAAKQAMAVPIDLIEAALQDRETIVPGLFTAADIQLTFFEELLEGLGVIGNWPNMHAHLLRMRRRDAYRRAEAKGGPVGLKQMFAEMGMSAA